MSCQISFEQFKKPIILFEYDHLQENIPVHAKVLKTDLVVIRYQDGVTVLYGRCLHRGALLADGHVQGNNLICGVHGWDFRKDTGVSEYNPKERLHKFSAAVKDNLVYIDEEEVRNFEVHEIPSPFQSDTYLGDFADTHPEPTEPYTKEIQALAKYGLEKYGHHGPTAAMGVDRTTLPQWNDLLFLPAQLSKTPLLDGVEVDSQVVIGKKAKKPLKLDLPLFVSDMSFGSLSREAKIALARGAELAGTGICSGEGGMLPDEQKENSKYFYELASAKFGFSWDKLAKVQAFHFKAGQAAKTGTGGHLPGQKVVGEIAKVRGLKEGEAAISPASFPDLKSVEDFRDFANKVREKTGGIPIGFKLSASHIEADIDFALAVGVDYIILDGRGGGTGAAPTILRDHICVPTIPALARAKAHLNRRNANDVSLIITGGLRVASDFAKALALGADAVAIANSAIQAVGCIGMRACHTNNCPVGVATQKENLRARLKVQTSALQLKRFLLSTNELMKVIARACGYNSFSQFNKDDLTTFNHDMYRLSGVKYAGLVP
ncbi:glutamate synthase-related protein [Ancylomarina longa]|uniref:Glutamate synthase n=1 Tax=Ancylomarina longa TaxID=2487017 RepID=A0A434AZF0_9BACT|nr:glutamate synthase-related protein [Ancylomarina longa]RUT79983.1 glutamate synthase [Ancylomarina longa]